MNIQNQHGISLVMALIMLVVLSMIAVSATYSTTSSLRIVGNMQSTDEATAAAQYWIENEMSSLSSFTNAAASNHNGTQMGIGSYDVAVSKPVCLSSTPISGNSAQMASTNNNTGGAPPNDTYWEFTATATDPTSGAGITVTQGVRMAIYPSQGC